MNWRRFFPVVLSMFLAFLILSNLAVNASVSDTYSVFATSSAYSVSQFAQFCAANSSICKKQDFDARSGSVSCPSLAQIVQTAYVHAGEGQTVRQLPDSGFSYSLSNNGNTANVANTTHQYDISWIAVVCTDPGTVFPSSKSPSTPTQAPVVPTQTPVATSGEMEVVRGLVSVVSAGIVFLRKKSS